jgi:hypothetical protein
MRVRRPELLNIGCQFARYRPSPGNLPKQQRDGLFRPSHIFKPCLLAVHEMATAVLLPALLVRLRAEWLFLAETDRLDAIRADTRLH